jgi:DNA (cytosine-5)-methyltransferase 1
VRRALFTFADLFAGIGGFRLGLEAAGGRCVYSLERDPFCRRTYAAWFGAEPEGRDIDDVEPSDVPPHHIMAAGFPCFAKGTLVLTRRGYEPIEDVAVGNEVLTHLGRWRRVTAVMARDDAPLRRVVAQGVDVVTTDEHPFLARVRTTRHLCRPRDTHVRSFDDPRWVAAEELIKDHFLAQIIPEVGPDGRTAEFWWLVGRYLADGWCARRKDRPGSGRTRICCAHAEADELRRRITVAGFHTSCVIRKSTVEFHISVNSFYRFLGAFGRLAHGKTLPGFALSLSSAKSAALLDGYMSGDGWAHKCGVMAKSVSKRLAFSMALLAQRAGIVASITYVPRPKTTVIMGKPCRQRSYWQISVPLRNTSGFVEGRYGWKKVRKSERCGRGAVCNLSVEEDESYMADGAVVHNCQPFSLAGVSKKNSLGKPHGFDCPVSGNLFFRLADTLDACRPPAFVFENVKNLKSHDSGNTWCVIQERLDALDYEVHARVLDAQDFGVPQHRERIFIVGFDRRRIPNPRFLFPKPTGGVPLRSILESDPPADTVLTDHLWHYLQAYKAKHAAKGHGFGYELADLDGVSRTLSARYHKDGAEILIPRDGGNPRRLSPRESARLMGFPDHLPVGVVSRTQTYKQFGNSVVPAVVEAVGRQVANFLNAAGVLRAG